MWLTVLQHRHITSDSFRHFQSACSNQPVCPPGHCQNMPMNTSISLSVANLCWCCWLECLTPFKSFISYSYFVLPWTACCVNHSAMIFFFLFLPLSLLLLNSVVFRFPCPKTHWSVVRIVGTLARIVLVVRAFFFNLSFHFPTTTTGQRCAVQSWAYIQMLPIFSHAWSVCSRYASSCVQFRIQLSSTITTDGPLCFLLSLPP